MGKFLFWQRWLFASLLFQAYIGLTIAFFGPSSVLGPLSKEYDQTTFGSPSVPDNAVVFYDWIYGVLGSTIVSWAIALAFVTHFAFKRQEKWAWNCILLSTLIWFLLDSSLSLKFGVWPNFIFNFVGFAMIVLPLVFTRSYFGDELRR